MRFALRFITASASALFATACTPSPSPSTEGPARTTPPQSSASAPVASEGGPFDISVIGTNDVHGHFDNMAAFGGFVAALKKKVGADRVLLVDAGDMFQGTLESNMNEGAAIVRAYNALGYDAAAVGNHEFDYGPVGPLATPRVPSDDPRGALRARALEARFPLLMANVNDAQTEKAPDYRNIIPSTIVEKHGAHIGLVGVTTLDTPRTTISANFAGLSIRPLAEAISREAASLRARGADVIVVLAHAGGKCKNWSRPDAPGECDEHQEAMTLLQELPHGTVDAFVAGHTHAAMATVVNGVPIIESFSLGKAFGRIDLTFDPKLRKIVRARVLPLQELKLPATYEGTAVEGDTTIAQTFADALAAAKEKKERKLGVRLTSRFKRSHDQECAEGNLFADIMRKSHPAADVALQNGGGLRQDLPEGDLAYGPLFEAMPFDNRFAVVPLTGRDLINILATNAADDHGILSVSGVSVEVACKAGKIDVAVFRRGPNGERGARVVDGDRLTLVTTDFIALGGDTTAIPAAGRVIEDELVRDAFEKGLTNRGILEEREVYDAKNPRWKLPMERPVRCAP
jgi:5'-nucleotidase